MSRADKKMTLPEVQEGELFPPREGEVALPFDPAEAGGDAHVVFIGHVRSPWTSRESCPKNMSAAAKAGGGARIEIAEAYRPGLAGLDGASHLILLTWLHHAPRNLILQKPRHASATRGVFALRSPARPNPVGVHVVRLIALDAETGVLTLEAIDVLDGTPVIDVKPYYASTDSVPDALPVRPA
jgi:tRNA-Thr(GGU) m(6)t(6)A37 methyltransferase TsaA